MAEKSRIYQRYEWLIDLIKRSGEISLEEIDSAWRLSTLNTIPNSPLSARTFHRHINDIKDIFGIVIKCNKSSHKYFIENVNEVKSGEVQKWMLSTLAYDNLLLESRDIRERIQFEEIPCGIQLLSIVIKAMHDNIVLHVVYQSSPSRSNLDTWIKPYILKQYHQKWYLIGLSGVHPKNLYTFALDRFISIEPTHDKFKYPKNFNPYEYKDDVFDDLHAEESVQTVVLKVSNNLVQYFDSLPLHKSQVKMTDRIESGYTFYKYRIVPTIEFIQNICSHCSNVEILEPKSLRNIIAKEIKKMYDLYI